jgi:hypothetical protein
MKKRIFLFFGICFTISISIFPQVVLFGPEPFDNNPLYTGSNVPTNLWFAPSYKTPFSHFTTGGCEGGKIGYSSSWNNFWGNFVRLPEINCTNHDTIILSFDVSHSYFQNHINDWCRFYMWADNGYKHNINTVRIDGVDITHDAGINGKGFKFSELRNCKLVEVEFDITNIQNKTNILLFIEASCGYNNSNLFEIFLDNVAVSGYGNTVNIGIANGLSALSITPTTVSNIMYINGLSKEVERYHLNIYNLSGQLVYKAVLSHNGNQTSVDIANLPEGLYFVELYDNSNQYYLNTKIVKI